MSDAKVKCSNCGAELTNLTFGWGKWQWLWGVVGFLPIVAILVWMQFYMFRPNRDFANEIQASLIETRVAQDRFDVVGQLKNVGSHTWDRVTVEAEIYDKDGKFLDETSGYIAMVLSPGVEEHFRLSLASPDEKILHGAPKVVLKVTDADEDRFSCRNGQSYRHVRKFVNRRSQRKQGRTSRPKLIRLSAYSVISCLMSC